MILSLLGIFSYVFCISVCKAPTVRNGAIEPSQDMLTHHHYCEVGFSLRGNAERSCLPEGGGWDQEEPECGMYNYLHNQSRCTKISYACESSGNALGDQVSNKSVACTDMMFACCMCQ